MRVVSVPGLPGSECLLVLWAWTALSSTIHTLWKVAPALATCVASAPGVLPVWAGREPVAFSPAVGVVCSLQQLGTKLLTQHLVFFSQIQKWGHVEWAHDYELRELRARTAAGALFIHLCSESTTVKHKLLQE